MYIVCLVQDGANGESHGIAGDGIGRRRRDPDHSVKDRQQSDTILKLEYHQAPSEHPARAVTAIIVLRCESS